MQAQALTARREPARQNRTHLFAGFALRSLLVSGLMATGILSGLSALAKIPHQPEQAIVRAPLLTSRGFAPTNAPAGIEVAAVSADQDSSAEEAESEATEPAGARPDYGFTRLFSTILAAKPEELGLSSDMLKFGPVRIRQDLVETILRAAQAAGADPVLLMAIADKESSFATGIAAATSSAVGLFQFIEATWFTVLRDHGTKHGLAREAALVSSEDSLPARERLRILDLRKNPYIAALMAAEMLKKDTAEIRARLGRDLTSEEIYLAHFLGPGDAYKFLAKVDTEPRHVAAKLLPKPARANKPIFYDRQGRKSKSLSVAEVHRKIEASMGLRLDRYRNVAQAMPTLSAYR